MKIKVVTALAGVLFGFSLSNIGFTSWDLVHSMFTFTELHLLFTFLFASAILIPGWWLMRRVNVSSWVKRSIHPGTAAGGFIFGMGWAISGACPGIAFVQVGEGQLGALWTILGIGLGNFVYAIIHPRFFGWSTGSCLDA